MLAISLALFALVSTAVAYPSYLSLAGLPREQLDAIIPTLTFTPPPPLPGPMNDTSTKLVYDAAHPFVEQQPGDQRGPCPALNTLASHGYIPHNGVATPSQIIDAVQEAFNMDNAFARFVALTGFLVNGNLITNEMSIGAKTTLTGPDVSPGTAGGLDTHNVFEGDTSMSRLDFYFGNNHDFNEELFDQFIEFSNRYGDGKYNLTVAGKLRGQRIAQSIATNPTFSFVSPRYFTAYTESAFPFQFFVDGRLPEGQLDLDAARSFFQDHRFPDDFHRANHPMTSGAMDVYLQNMTQPGTNVKGVNSFMVDPTSPNFDDVCGLYTNHVNKTVRGLYPHPTGNLLVALNTNLDYYYQAFIDSNPGVPCEQVFPYGK